ncbi:hypothetical protein SNE40_020919 [Patella caerulea]|uniref:C2H2-type domain-containing protein n=1 Tax=Patella caerulea TaxID=87958 RepID=A0AAN8G5R9_PATCE
MTTIFGQVTAEVAGDLPKKFPNDFDFSSMIEKVSEDAGVVLLFSEQQYKLQGLWVSMEKAYSLLATTLGIYGARITSTKNEITVSNYSDVFEGECLPNPSKENEKDKIKQNKSGDENNEGNVNKTNNNSIPEKTNDLIPQTLNTIIDCTKEIEPSHSRYTRRPRLCNGKHKKSDKNGSESETVKITKKRQGRSRLALQNTGSIKPKKLEQTGPKISSNDNANITGPNDASNQGVQRRKRGRPKKNLSLTSSINSTTNLVKQKIYKYTKYKSNFVRRPFIVRSLLQTDLSKNNKNLGKEELEVVENKDDDEDDNGADDTDDVNDADITEKDIIDNGEDDDDDDVPVTFTRKRGRGRPRKSDTEKKYPCSDCDFIAVNGNMLNDHKHRTHRAFPTKCDVCNKVFPNKRYMMRHRTSHVEPQHCCDICGKMYKVKKSMEDHRKTHDAGYTKPVFDCSQCCKKFCNGYILKCHIKSEHLGEKKSFLCSRCGKSFTTKHSLQEHSNAHIGLKPHICDICGKGFNYESALRDHKYTHTESRKFTCSICNKHFCQRSSLKMHMRIHAVDKKFVCEDCGRGFTQKQALQRHERVHKGFKPFVCKICRRTFTDSSIIRRHLILVHKINKDSNSWREDIICKIGPTKFRVEKIDEAKQEVCEQSEDEVIEALPSFHTQIVEHSYSVKDDLDALGNGDSLSGHMQADNNHHHIQLESCHSNNLLLPPLPSTTLPQVIDYSDRNTNSVNSMQSSHGMIADDRQNNMVEDQQAAVPTSSPTVWSIPLHGRDQNIQNHHHPHHNPTTTHHQPENQPQIDIGSLDPRDYPHLHRSATPQYLPIQDVDNQMRCNSVNYAPDIRHHEVPSDPNHPSTSQTQWPSIYAYYSQLASQFGMNLNEYPPSSGYGMHPQGSPQQQQQPQQQ